MSFFVAIWAQDFFFVQYTVSFAMAFELHRRLTSKTSMSQMMQMIPWETPAEAALPKPMRRRRPKGAFGAGRVQVVRFSIDEGMEGVSELAAKKNYAVPWDWDGKGYQKRRRSQGPNQFAPIHPNW